LLRSTFVCGAVGLWLVMLRELRLTRGEPGTDHESHPPSAKKSSRTVQV
jgi:hypothetical protein